MPLFGWSSGVDQPDADQSERRTTRSQTAANLQLPPPTNASGVGCARPRTPSPLPVGHNNNSAVIFSYDSTNLSQVALQQQHHPELRHSDAENDEELQAVSAAASQHTMTSSQTPEEMRASVAAAVDAANSATAALQAATSFMAGMQQQQEQLQRIIDLQQQQLQQQQPNTQVKLRKPELPDFDSRNIEVWIKRMTAAYERAGIVLAKDKFAFLETKFKVGANPKIDEFLYGSATDASWTEFIAYLKLEYGRTVRQEAQFLRAQHSRDGRRPTQMLAHILDKIKRVSIDDVVKDIVVSSLPTDVQRMLADKVADMTAEQAAVMADSYFDQEGKPLHSSSNVSISHIAPTLPQSAQTEDASDETDVNAVQRRGGFRPRGGAGFNNRFSRPPNNAPAGQPNRMGYKNRHEGAVSQHPSTSSSTSFKANASAAASDKKPRLCRNHDKFGNEAYSCHPSCSRWPEMQRIPGNGQAGNRK